MRSKHRTIAALAAAVLSGLLLAGSLPAPAGPGSPTGIRKGQLLRVRVPGPSLEGNLLGAPSERDGLVYLPPSYERDRERRYPLLIILHGITDGTGPWEKAWPGVEPGFGTVRDLMDRGVAEGRLEEMIIVIPDARTPYSGCFYANSPVKGNWEDFIAEDLVHWADSRFRTLPAAESRGVMGHSMGGHGAIRLGMKRPDVFSAVYGMNPGVMDWAADVSAENPAFRQVHAIEKPEDLEGASFYVMAVIGVSQAFSPNPGKPPFFADYPFAVENGRLVSSQPAHSRWEENMPVKMAGEYAENLKSLAGLRFDSAFTDKFPHIPLNSRALSEELTRLGVEHTFEMYNGDHHNRLWGRQGRVRTEVLPWFSDLLVQDGARRRDGDR